MKDSEDKDILKWSNGRLDFSAGTILMGILNVTSDSFSDGGLFLDSKSAVRHGLEMAREGASVIDVGGQSTRPGAKPVTAQEQMRRVVPVIEELSAEIDIPVSIDTSSPVVAKAALDAGASMLNDITALQDDNMAEIVAEARVPVVLMHIQGTPADMQVNPVYEDVVGEILGFLLSRGERAESFGISQDYIFIDPGFGFGKTVRHNLSLLKNIHEFVATDYRVLAGTSRKSFLGSLTGQKEPAERTFATAATVAVCALAGVSVVRVHDVAEMFETTKVANAVRFHL